MCIKKTESGFSLLEIMIAVAIIGIFFAGTAVIYLSVGKGILTARGQTVANNLAQEKIESLKNVDYSRLRVTSITDYSTYGYDKTYYPPETGILVGDISYERRVLIQRAEENAGGTLVEVLPDAGDTGLKKITVIVQWVDGGRLNSVSLSNVREDPDRRPLDGTISGTVKDFDTALPVSDVKVAVQDNINWNAVTDASGQYSIKVSTGIYYIKSSKQGYWQYTSPALTVTNAVTTHNFNIKKMATGNATGYVFINDRFVVSKICASTTSTIGEDIEWVELYNPTTYYWAMDSLNFTIQYVDEFNVIGSPINLAFVTPNIPPYSYWIISNTTTISLNAYSISADAYYTGNIIQANKAGGIIANYGGNVIDKLGWGPSSGVAPSNAVEGQGILSESGLTTGKTHVRLSAPPAILDIAAGNAFDSDNNAYNFTANQGAGSYLPLNSSYSRVPVSGRPAYGAIISCEDGISSPATAYMDNPLTYKTAVYNLTGIATGTWSVWAYYSGSQAQASGQIDNLKILTNGQTVGIPNATTVPAWHYPGYNYLVLSSAPTTGFVSGFVKNGSTPVLGIKVQAGVMSSYTQGDGSYLLALEPDTYFVIANPGNLDLSYVSQTIENIVVNLGMTTGNVNFDISPGGGIGGKVVSNAGDNLPDILVLAYDKNNNEVQSALSGTDGLWSMSNLPVSGNPYHITPSLDSREEATPDERNVSITAGVVKSSDNANQYNLFTIAPALGEIAGTIAYQGSPIETGVLVIASTGTIGSVPTDINDTFRTGSSVYYGTASHSDGTYRIEVRGGYTYNVYAWYSYFGTNGQIETSQKSASSGNVNSGTTKTVNFNWP